MKLPLPQLRFSIGGGWGGGQMHKRTNPKTFRRAKELHRNMTPAEVELWAHLRTHRMNGVHFWNQHAIGNYIVDFCASRKKFIIELEPVRKLRSKPASPLAPHRDAAQRRQLEHFSDRYLDGSKHLEQEEYDQEPRKVRPEKNRDKAGAGERHSWKSKATKSSAITMC